MLWPSRRIATEKLGARTEREIRSAMMWLATLAKKGTTDFKYKRIGGLWFYDPESFDTTASNPPKRHVTRLQEVVLGRRGA